MATGIDIGDGIRGLSARARGTAQTCLHLLAAVESTVDALASEQKMTDLLRSFMRHA